MNVYYTSFDFKKKKIGFAKANTINYNRSDQKEIMITFLKIILLLSIGFILFYYLVIKLFLAKSIFEIPIDEFSSFIEKEQSVL